MRNIAVVLKAYHVVGIPLQHLASAIEILRMVVGATDSILINMRQLGFNPCGVVALFMKNGAHGMTEAVTRNPACITNSLKHLIDAGFAHGLTWSLRPGNSKGNCPVIALICSIMANAWVESGMIWGRAHFHAFSRNFPQRFLGIDFRP